MITTLPFELIVLIAVELGDDVRSLARFAQTCKYIHTALRPLCRVRLSPLLRLPPPVLQHTVGYAYPDPGPESEPEQWWLAANCMSLARTRKHLYGQLGTHAYALVVGGDLETALELLYLHGAAGSDPQPMVAKWRRLRAAGVRCALGLFKQRRSRFFRRRR